MRTQEENSTLETEGYVAQDPIVSARQVNAFNARSKKLYRPADFLIHQQDHQESSRL